MSIKIIKRGTADWWFSMAITHIKPCKKGEIITIDKDEINRWIESVNRNPFKLLWILLTNGDIKQRDVTEEERWELLGKDKQSQ